MLKKPDPKPPEDEVTQKLRAAARKRRPLTWKGLLLLLTLFLVPVGLFVWWVYPKPEPPRLDVVAFDQLGPAGQDIDLHAILEPLEVDPAQVNLAGYPLFFEENMLPGKAGNKVKETASVGKGLAAISWRFPEGSKKSFVVRLPGDRQRRGAMDRAQVYLWPKDTPLLLVDVQSTLSSAKAEDWRTKNPLEIQPRPEAAKALQAVHKKKFQVVYLALEAERPLAYRKVRGWVENQVNSKNPFPAGPVLGRKTYGVDGGAAAVLSGLKRNFQGPLVAVVGHGEAAAMCCGLGIDTILIGADPAPKDVVRVQSWAEVPEKTFRKP